MPTTDVAGPLTVFDGVTTKSTDMVGFAVSAGPIVSSAGSSTGEDEEGATTAFSLSIANAISGLLTTDGDAITLTLEFGIVVGRDVGGNAVFAISIDAVTGVVSVAQYELIEHPTGGASYDEAVNLGATVNAVMTVTDGDGDVATNSVAIGSQIVFEDDGPTAILPDHAVVTNSGAGPGPLPLPTFELDQDGTLADNYGADEGGTVRFPSSLENSPSGLSSGGAAINYHVTNNGLTLTGTTTGGTDVFVIQLNPATATYTVDMIGPVDVTTDVNFSSGGFDFAGGNTAWNGFIPITEELGGVFLDNNSPDLLLTPERARASLRHDQHHGDCRRRWRRWRRAPATTSV